MPAVLRAGRRAPTSPACRPVACATATSGSSTARRCGRRSPTSSRWGLLVVRTDPEAVEARGLTVFVVDMHAPGVEVRPLRQMTGEAEFNEVYFTDVRIPDAETPRRRRRRLAGLAHDADERAGVDRRRHRRRRARARSPSACRLWRTLPDERKDPAHRDELMQLWIEAEVLPPHQHPGQPEPQDGRRPGPRARSASSASAELNKEIYDFVRRPARRRRDALRRATRWCGRRRRWTSDTLQKAFLRSRANSIEGGTTEVMRNILGERVLGLPGDVRVDREVAWKDVPRN